MENNRRLKELKLSFYICKIDSIEDKLAYNRIMRLLSCLAGALGREEHSAFASVTMQSVGGALLGATDKEIVATAKTFFSNRHAAELLGITNTTFYNRYNDLLNRDFITKEYLDNLVPMFSSEKEMVAIDLITSFIENFKFKLGSNQHPLRDNERTLEIEFWLIYNKLLSIINNSGVCDKFIFTVCNLFDIDYNAINQLKSNVHLINRQYPHFKYNNRYFMQEIVYLYDKKGLSKCQIAQGVLDRASNFLYIGTNKAYNNLIDNSNADWQYTPTLDWSNISKGNVMKFINLFHTFIEYDI